MMITTLHACPSLLCVMTVRPCTTGQFTGWWGMQQAWWGGEPQVSRAGKQTISLYLKPLWTPILCSRLKSVSDCRAATTTIKAILARLSSFILRLYKFNGALDFAFESQFNHHTELYTENSCTIDWKRLSTLGWGTIWVLSMLDNDFQ